MDHFVLIVFRVVHRIHEPDAVILREDIDHWRVDIEGHLIVVKADEKVKSSKIMEIMNAAQDAEYKKLIVAGEPLSKKEQKELEKNRKEG